MEIVKMKRTKIFAAYLPQYHETEDNNRFWGKGFTDWVGVKKATPLFENHNQPRIPLDKNYYDLLNPEVIAWQARIAKEYGIDGFNIYHYWFKDGKQELQKPAEILLEHNDIDIEYFFTWDNASWKRTWDNVQGNDWAPAFDDKSRIQKGTGILVEFQYGGEKQWREHFMYLLPFFQDTRYLKIDNKPVFLFIGRSDEETLKKMYEYWNDCAIEFGFDGIYSGTKKKNFFNKAVLDTTFCYEPETSAWGRRRAIDKRLVDLFGIKPKRDGAAKYIYTYEKVWKRIIANARKNANKEILGGFVRYDDTPRRGNEALIVLGETPDMFEKYMSQLYEICCNNNKEFLLLTAWNEWGEGAYLEPDVEDKYGYLEALKRVKNEH